MDERPFTKNVQDKLPTNDEGMMPRFSKEELEEIRKWAEVMGYQGKAKELEKALELNRGIVEKCDVGLGRGVPARSYMEDGTQDGA